jgi:PAS domain S-box-containing protein
VAQDSSHLPTQSDSELAFRESAQSYLSLFDSLAELVFIAGLDGRLLSVNKALLRRFGYTREQVIGTTPDLLIEQLIPGQIAAHADEDRGVPRRLEFSARTRDGDRFTLEMSFVRGRYFGADVIIAVGQDITERRQQEDALAVAESHYRRLVENAPYAIFALDRESRFTELSPAAREILGRDPAELIGRHMTEIIAPEDQPFVVESLRRKVTGEIDTPDIELRLVHSSGEYRLVHIRVTVILDAGVAAGVHGIARDITEDRARQEELSLLAAALEGIDQGVTIARPDGQLVYANLAHGRLLGYDPERRPLPHISEFFAGDDDGEQLQAAMLVALEKGFWSGRVLRTRRDGQVMPLHVFIGRVDRYEREPLLFALSRDVTEDLKRQQHLRRVERLATVGTLIGGVAHELNNPLHAISNFAELMLNEPRSDQDREDLDTIRREAGRAAKIVADLRLLARTSQDIASERALVDLNEVVRHVLKTRRYALSTRNIELREDLATGLPPIRADRGDIEQVVLNLVVNAEQAIERCEGIRRLILRSRAADDGVALYVVDSGPGIAPEHLDRIFDPFFTTKAPGEGTGLGLSLVYNIVAEHGGEIHVESEFGNGAAFRVHFPVAVASPSEPATAQAAGATGRRLCILVVDDEAPIRTAVTRYLTRRGHEVHMAAEGREALRLVDARNRDGLPYDVILSDLRMPGVGGDQLHAHLRSAGAGLDRRLIFMTGDAAGGDAARIIAEAGVPVIYKPIQLDELARRVELCAEEGRRSQAVP